MSFPCLSLSVKTNPSISHHPIYPYTNFTSLTFITFLTNSIFFATPHQPSHFAVFSTRTPHELQPLHFSFASPPHLFVRHHPAFARPSLIRTSSTLRPSAPHPSPFTNSVRTQTSPSPIRKPHPNPSTFERPPYYLRLTFANIISRHPPSLRALPHSYPPNHPSITTCELHPTPFPYPNFFLTQLLPLRTFHHSRTSRLRIQHSRTQPSRTHPPSAFRTSRPSELRYTTITRNPPSPS